MKKSIIYVKYMPFSSESESNESQDISSMSYTMLVYLGMLPP